MDLVSQTPRPRGRGRPLFAEQSTTNGGPTWDLETSSQARCETDPFWDDEMRPLKVSFVDERQITHLICARLKYDLYDFFRGVFGPFI